MGELVRVLGRILKNPFKNYLLSWPPRAAGKNCPTLLGNSQTFKFRVIYSETKKKLPGLPQHTHQKEAFLLVLGPGGVRFLASRWECSPGLSGKAVRGMEGGMDLSLGPNE